MCWVKTELSSTSECWPITITTTGPSVLSRPVQCSSPGYIQPFGHPELAGTLLRWSFILEGVFLFWIQARMQSAYCWPSEMSAHVRNSMFLIKTWTTYLFTEVRRIRERGPLEMNRNEKDEERHEKPGSAAKWRCFHCFSSALELWGLRHGLISCFCATFGSSGTGALTVPRTRTKPGEVALRVPHLWNKMPGNLRLSSSGSSKGL